MLAFALAWMMSGSQHGLMRYCQSLPGYAILCLKQGRCAKMRVKWLDRQLWAVGAQLETVRRVGPVNRLRGKFHRGVAQSASAQRSGR